MEHIKISDDKELYFVSDFHFCHRKLVKESDDAFEMPRDFETIEEMNDAIVKSMQLGPNSVVVFLGDFLMNVPGSQLRDKFYEFFDKFSIGQMIMVTGNHDHMLKKKLKNDNVTFYPYAIIEHRGKTYFCQHRDFNENGFFLKQEKATLPEENLFFVHGHTHSPILLSRFEETHTQNNVCFDVAHRPIAASELFAEDEDQLTIELDADVLEYYEKLAAEREMSLDQLIEDTIHHAMNDEQIKKEIDDALKEAYK